MRSSFRRAALQWVLLLFAIPFLTLQPAYSQDTTGELSLTVVVIDELMARPVPLTNFKVTSLSVPSTEQVVRTDEQGIINIKLPPGKYTVETVHPVRFKGHSLTWKTSCAIRANEICQLKLTDADASLATESPARQVSDEAGIYRDLKAGVVTVECDFGNGSGFVVDKRGLILTNQHVTNGTHWAAVRFDRGLRIQANVIQEDKTADVAVLQFNPEAFKGFRVLPLADVTHGPVAVEGEKILAIGSPLHQEKILTTGIISKVDSDVLISDVNINHGNSGGPLLNLAGEAIGITTFADLSDQGGPGISGIVAIQKAIPVLEAAQQRLDALAVPSAELLPDVSPVPIPSDALSEASLRTKKPTVLKAPKNFVTCLYTPFTRASLQAARDRELARNKNLRAKRRSDKGVKEGYQFDPERSWLDHASNRFEPVVYVEVHPVLRETSGSQWRAAFGAALNVRTTHDLRYRDDFYDMALYRGDQLAQPVRRGRFPVSMLYSDAFVEAKDAAYGGQYQYDPSVFEPSQPLYLKVRKESNLEKCSEVKIDPKLQKQIWEEFAPYRAALEVAKRVQGPEAQAVLTDAPKGEKK
jgi:hypothetical protein